MDFTQHNVIRAYLQTHPGAETPTVRLATGLTGPQTSNALFKLQALGLVEKKGKRRSFTYHPTKAGLFTPDELNEFLARIPKHPDFQGDWSLWELAPEELPPEYGAELEPVRPKPGRHSRTKPHTSLDTLKILIDAAAAMAEREGAEGTVRLLGYVIDELDAIANG